MPAKISPEQHPETSMETLTRALTQPFDPKQVKFKPAVVSGNRAMALAYVDARVIQDRLDEVLGVGGWQDDYEALPDGSVICRLRLKLGKRWITKVDVGGPSEQPDGGDRLKAAFSDALKRAAVKFGIGRYLYRLPVQWADYDPQRRQFTQPPRLPANAVPAREPETPTKPALKTALHTLPANGTELQKRLLDYEAKLVTQHVCERGQLLQHVQAAGAKAGYPVEMSTWSGAAIVLAVEETKRFEHEARQRRPERKEVA
ncbi:MAG: hypothetical protein JNM56_13530 [Planctomycetia bacterium]|nr:hypothetical protein [Planctomycetia bacterium]